MVKVSKKQKILLAFNPMGYNICGGLIGGSFLKFFVDIIGLEAIWFGIAYFIYGIWNAVNDPFIGIWSDRKEPKAGKGKRKPFFRRSIPIALFSMFLMIFISPSWDDLTIFIVLLVGLIIYDVGGTIFYINQNALNIAITDDPNERASISTLTSLIGQINGALIGAIPFLFLTGDFPYEFIIVLFSSAVLLGMGLLTYTSSKIQEPIEIYGKPKEHLPMKKALKETLKSKAFICFVIVAFSMTGIGSAFGATILFYLNDVYGYHGFEALFPAMFAGLVEIPTMPLIYYINKRFGVRSTLFIFLWVMFLGFLGFYFKPDFWVLVFFYWCILTGFNSMGIVSNAAYGDITDEDELKTGERREGMYLGIASIFTIPASSIFVFLFTLFLTMFGYDGEAVVQTETALYGIRLGTSLLPMIFLAIGAITLYFYPFHGEPYREMKAEIRKLYEEKLHITNSENEKN